MYENVPYLSIIFDKLHERNELGLIQLVSKNYMSFYNVKSLKNNDYIPFFRLAEKWWARCPMFPISLYYKNEFKNFNYLKQVMNTGTYQIVGGYQGTSFNSLSEKRIKRRIIHLEY